MKQTVLDAKIEQVNIIKEKLENSQSSVIVEYRGLTVGEVTKLRTLLRAEGVEFKVYKNSLLTRAAEACGFEELNSQLTGPNAIAFGEDAVAPCRVLAKFAKIHKKLVLKGAVIEGKVVGLDTIKELSLLPNRDGLLSMFLGCLQSPVRDFACVVKAIADNMSEGQTEVVDEKKEEVVVEAVVVEASAEVTEDVAEATAE